MHCRLNAVPRAFARLLERTLTLLSNHLTRDRIRIGVDVDDPLAVAAVLPRVLPHAQILAIDALVGGGRLC